MSVEQRIRMSLLIEKINGQKAFSKKLGLEDRTLFHGEYVWKEEKGVIDIVCDTDGNGIW